MAVINSPQIGIARGKLGDAVYYRSKGNTNARSYNPNTTNRRTVNQQSQRSLFSSAVKFFSRGTQNLFVFAYEDKRTQESDYNAFMRYNAKRGMFFGPDQNENPAYPALGDWILTHGSLPRLDYKRGDDGFEIDVNSFAGAGDISTVGQLSTLLLVAPEWSPGDIFTIVSIGSDSLLGTPTEPVRVGSSEPYWIINQFIVDEADNTNLDDFGLTFHVDGLRSYLTCSVQFPLAIVGITAFAAIHSRNVNGQLRVSDATLIYNHAGNVAIENGRSDSWKEIVLAAWGSEQLSILQGGIASRAASVALPKIFIGFDIGSTVDEADTKSIFIEGSQSGANIAEHLKIVINDDTLLTLSVEESNIVMATSGADLVCRLLIGTAGTWTSATFNLSGSQLPDEVISSIYWE